MEGDAPGLLRSKAQSLAKVPGNGLSLAVLIGCKPNRVCLCGQGFQFGHGFLLFGRHHILRGEAVVQVNAEFFLLKISDMSFGRNDLEIVSKEFLYGLRLVRGLDYH